LQLIFLVGKSATFRCFCHNFSVRFLGSACCDVRPALQANSVGDAIAILQHATKVAQEIQEEVLRTGWGGDVVGGSKSSKSGTIWDHNGRC
jgi:hypothetical protein